MSCCFGSRKKICNSNRFHRLDRNQLVGLRSDDMKKLALPSSEILTPTTIKSWLLIDAPQAISHSKMTSKGIRIKIEEVPEGVILAHQFFYICVDCGKCYWGMTRIIHFKILYLQYHNF